ncbi:hypothetical protein [Pelagicoccus mobilis]|uniref:Uncharacterized protein n=1 Tax=Pelagicoccus mobilis TaxID=415221 RepID=A0A934RY22_9BACT|nr:hypothetical protein [Pelagicoccus mobilis]MBK1875979.1 hypothetical protein [Pelagicoccus mobilis]
MAVEKLSLDFGEFELSEELFIARINPAHNLTADDMALMVEVASERYSAPFGYISDRVNRYSVDPIAMSKIFDALPLLTSFAVVVGHQMGREMAKYEQGFAGHDRFEVFWSLGKATDWVLERNAALRAKLA